MNPLRQSERLDEDLLEISARARKLVAPLLKQKDDPTTRALIVSILTDEAPHWRHKEAICDALTDGRVPLWEEAREALEGLLCSSHKLLCLAALLPLLLESDNPADTLERIQNRLPTVMRWGSKMVKMILASRHRNDS